MDDLQISYLINVYQQTKKDRQYLQQWNKMDEAQKKESTKDNQSFWDDIYDETPLAEDPIPRKKPDLKGCIEDDKIPPLLETG